MYTSLELIQILILQAILVLIVIYEFFKLRNYEFEGNIKLFVLFLIVFCVFYAWGYDYHSYRWRVLFVADYNYSDYLEPFYAWVVKNITSNYIAWRGVIWGLASLIIGLTLQRKRENSRLFMLLFIILPLIQSFYFQRQSLAFAIWIYGMSHIVEPSEFNVTRSKYLGIACIILSVLFHKSMLLFVLLSSFCYFFRLNRKIFFISLVLFPLLYALVPLFISVFLNFGLMSDFQSNTAEIYLEEKASVYNLTLLGYFQLFIQRAPLLWVIYEVSNDEEFNDNNYLKSAYMLFYVALLLVGQTLSYHLSLRLWIGGVFPMMLFLNQYLPTIWDTKQCKRTIYLLCFAFFWLSLSNINSLFK